MENSGYSSIIGSHSAPYLNRLSNECGLATNYHAITHPSLPNYLALTSGTTDAITDDNEPSSHRLTTPNLFSQLNGNWSSLEESMPTACDMVTSGSYATRHDPAVYYTNLGATCSKNVQPLHLPPKVSRPFTFVTPNICNDMHSCPIATGDAWLARFVPLVLRSSEYRAHRTALFITWDEGTDSSSNQVATIVVAPSVPRGRRVTADLNHFSLLRSTEQLLNLPYLGAAKSAVSMIKPFGL